MKVENSLQINWKSKVWERQFLRLSALLRTLLQLSIESTKLLVEILSLLGHSGVKFIKFSLRQLPVSSHVRMLRKVKLSIVKMYDSWYFVTKIEVKNRFSRTDVKCLTVDFACL